LSYATAVARTSTLVANCLVCWFMLSDQQQSSTIYGYSFSTQCYYDWSCFWGGLNHKVV